MAAIVPIQQDATVKTDAAFLVKAEAEQWSGVDEKCWVGGVRRDGDWRAPSLLSQTGSELELRALRSLP